MTKIYIQGILVGPDYDLPDFAEEIERGVFCPSSRILRQIDEANGDDIEIHISSEGGDVFAFNAVSSRIADYAGTIRIVIDSCAFSEAANLALMCGRPVYIHRNSVMLWHSAMSTVEDAAVGELRSEAALLERINRPVQQALEAAGVPRDEVERGFRDGSALVLGAEELVRYGIATLLPGESDEPRDVPRIDEALSIRIAALARANQRIAAHYAHKAPVNTSVMDTNTTILTEDEKKRLETPVVEAADEEDPDKRRPCAADGDEPAETETPADTETPAETETPDEAETPAETETPDEGQPAEGDELLTLIETLVKTVDGLRAKTADLDKRVAALEGKLTTTEVELVDARKALKAERAKRVGAIAAAVSQSKSVTGPSTWPEAVKACKGDKMEAFQRFPQLCKQWVSNSK